MRQKPRPLAVAVRQRRPPPLKISTLVASLVGSFRALSARFLGTLGIRSGGGGTGRVPTQLCGPAPSSTVGCVVVRAMWKAHAAHQRFFLDFAP